MARIRTIKPEFFTSLAIIELPIPTRLTFIGLWTHADDYGRCVDDPALIRSAIWPIGRTISAVARDLDVLADTKRIERYEVSGRRYLQVINWDEHQKINRRGPPRCPPPPEIH